MAVSGEQRAYFLSVAEKCVVISGRLARRADRHTVRRNAIRIANLTVGFAAALVTLSPDVRGFLGGPASDFVQIGSSSLLLLGTLYFMFLGTNPPERFRDYAEYIRHYSDQINLMLAGDVDELVKAKLINLSELALKNITDAITRWPDLETSAA